MVARRTAPAPRGRPKHGRPRSRPSAADNSGGSESPTRRRRAGCVGGDRPSTRRVRPRCCSSPKPVLDPRLYRAALAPILFALILAAFSLEDLPRPLRSTLAPDAFQSQRAFRDLNEMVRTYPNRRPGDASDEALARRVASELRNAGLPGGPRPFDVRLA